MEYIFTIKSNIKKPLVKILHINTNEQHCSVNAVCFLCEYSNTNYYKYQLYNLYILIFIQSLLCIFYKQSNLFNSTSRLLFKSANPYSYLSILLSVFCKRCFCLFVLIGYIGFNFGFLCLNLI